jgi:hypothetical protein
LHWAEPKEVKTVEFAGCSCLRWSLLALAILFVVVARIREVLGDSVESPRFVETVTRRGYRFLADVAVIDIPDRQSEPTPDALASPSDTAPVDRTDAGASSKQAVRPYIWSLVFGLALVLTVLKAFASRWPRLPAS